MKKILLLLSLMPFLGIGLIDMKAAAPAVPGQASPTLPPDMQYEIILQTLRNTKDKKSLKQVLETISSLKNTNKSFAEVIVNKKDEFKQKLAKQIKEHNIQVNVSDAMEFKSPVLAEILIEKHADINAPDAGGQTLLHKAAQTDNVGIAQLLLDKNANIEALDNQGRTPLLVAVENMSKNIIEFLINKGADVSKANKVGITPLRSAIKNKHVEVAKLLIQNGAQITPEILKELKRSTMNKKDKLTIYKEIKTRKPRAAKPKAKRHAVFRKHKIVRKAGPKRIVKKPVGTRKGKPAQKAVPGAPA